MVRAQGPPFGIDLVELTLDLRDALVFGQLGQSDAASPVSEGRQQAGSPVS